jgi:sec-independent protein translocase protein TatC
MTGLPQKVADDDEAHIEASRAPLLDHLIELRQRLIWSLIAFAVSFVFCYFFSARIYEVLNHPLAEALAGQPNRKMIYTGLPEAFFTYVKVAAFGAICISFPVLATQIYLFVAPGLYRNERRAFLPFLLATPLLFVLGAMTVYFVMMPFIVDFFLSFETPGAPGSVPIQLEARISEYLNFVMSLIISFGVCFQMPVLLTLLGRVGLLSSDYLRRNRRYAIVIVSIVAAILTPADALSMISLMIPLLALYEVSVWCVVLVEKRREQARAEAGSSV